MNASEIAVLRRLRAQLLVGDKWAVLRSLDLLLKTVAPETHMEIDGEFERGGKVDVTV